MFCRPARCWPPSPAPAGGKPANRNRSVGRPDTTNHLPAATPVDRATERSLMENLAQEDPELVEEIVRLGFARHASRAIRTDH